MTHCDFAVGHAVPPCSRRAWLVLMPALWWLHHFGRDGPAVLVYDLPMNDCCSCERDTRALPAQWRRVLLAVLAANIGALVVTVTATEVPPALS